MNPYLETDLAAAPPDPQEVREALEHARRILAGRPELAKGGSFVNGCFCIVAAITAASRTKQIRDTCLDAAHRALPWGVHSIQDYNDFTATTIEDAKTLLEKAKSNVRMVAV